MKQKQHRGFTLVELLVVIAILSVLAALLLPTIEASMEMARRVSCANNLRQQSFALNSYVENEGKYPYYSPGPFFLNQWAGKKGTGMPSSNMRAMNAYLGYTEPVGYTTSGVLEVLHCPSDIGSDGGFQVRKPSYWDFFGNSYVFNSNCNTNNISVNGVAGKRPAQIKSPTRCVIVAEGSFTHTYFFNWNPFGIHYWHDKTVNGVGNVLFADGHVAYHMITFETRWESTDWTLYYNH